MRIDPPRYTVLFGDIDKTVRELNDNYKAGIDKTDELIRELNNIGVETTRSNTPASVYLGVPYVNQTQWFSPVVKEIAVELKREISEFNSYATPNHIKKVAIYDCRIIRKPNSKDRVGQVRYCKLTSHMLRRRKKK